MWEPSRRFWSGTCDISGVEGVRFPSGIGASSGEVHDGYGAE